MQSKNFDIEILSLNHVQFRVDYYSSNKEHLEIWHPTTPKRFYTFKYQENKINEQLKSVNNGESAQFVIVDKEKTKMLGHCNYTKIKKINVGLDFQYQRYPKVKV